MSLWNTFLKNVIKTGEGGKCANITSETTVSSKRDFKTKSEVKGIIGVVILCYLPEKSSSKASFEEIEKNISCPSYRSILISSTSTFSFK